MVILSLVSRIPYATGERLGESLRSAIYNDCPVHQLSVQIAAPHGGEAEDRHHHEDESARQDADRLAEFTQVPGPAAEAVANEEGLDEDGDCKGYHGCYGPYAKQRRNSNRPAEDQEQQADAHARVEPYGVDRCVGVLVDPLDPEGHGETSVARIGERDSGCGDHAALAHGEATDDGESEDSESGLLGHHLHEVGGPRLSEVRTHDRWDVDDGVCDDQL